MLLQFADASLLSPGPNDRRDAEDEVFAGRLDYELVTRATNDLVWVWDLGDDSRQAGNGFVPRLADLTGSSLGTRKLWLEKIHPDDRERAAASLDMALASNRSVWQETYRIRRQDGRYSEVFDGATIIRNAYGRPVRLIGGMRNLTERERLTSEQEHVMRMESIGMIAAGVAHDLNNVLSPVLMAVGMLRHPETSPADLKLLETVEANLTRGADLLRQIVSFARSPERERTMIKLDRLVADVAGILTETFPRSINVLVHAAPSLWQVHGNAAGLQQVLLNLAVNARDAMPRGGTLTIRAENITRNDPDPHAANKTAPAKQVLLEITDTGIGIAPEIRRRIFEPYFTTKPDGRGTGLGLASVQAVVKSLCGCIEVTSEIGRGTTFKVYLPAVESRCPFPVVPSVVDIARGTGQLLLVVDDEATVLSLMQRSLETFGYRVIAARDGVEAVAAFARQRDQIDLILTDSDMPNMGGEDEVRALFELNPKAKILVMSGLGAEDSLKGIRELPIKRILCKPFTVEMLLETVHSILAPSRTVQTPAPGVMPMDYRKGPFSSPDRSPNPTISRRDPANSTRDDG